MFYTVVRIFYKGEAETHSVEHKASLLEAQQRYFNIIASDLQNAEVTYNAAYIISSTGTMLEGRVFDRRPTPEPEPEEEA